MPTTQEAAITNLRRGVRNQYGLYRKNGDLTDAEYAAIGAAWLPDSGWTNVTEQTSLTAGLSFGSDASGPTLGFTVRNQRRAEWPDGRAMALVARHWDGGGWSPFYTVCIAFIVGDGTQDLDRGQQTGTVNCGVTFLWAKTPMPPIRLGRANLALTATVAGSSPVLMAPNAEAPLEYLSQAAHDGTMATDGNVDTVAVADVIAAPIQPTLGDTGLTLRVLRVYAGRTSRIIGAGSEPLWMEIWAGHNICYWGTFSGAIPDMYNISSGENQPAVREDAAIKTAVVTYGDGSKGFQVLTKANTGRTTWIQWFITDGNYLNRPMRVKVDIKAASGFSIGRLVRMWVTDARSVGATQIAVEPLALSADWSTYTFDFDSSTPYAGAKFNVTTLANQNVGGDLVYELRNLRVEMGFDADQFGALNGYIQPWVGMDDGAGRMKWVRVSWSLNKDGSWKLPPFGSLVITDDLATFKTKFDAGGRQVFQMKNFFPEWFFGPGVGRIRLALMQNPPDLNNIYVLPSEAVLLDDIDFAVANGGNPWQPYQGLTRQNPLGTGTMVAEDYPQPGMGQAYGSAYWWWDLKAYVPPTLLITVSATATRLPLNDLDKVGWAGYVKIESEWVWYHGKDGEGLVVVQRGYNGTTPAQHVGNTAVYPGYDGQLGLGLNVQTGPAWDYVEVRRKDGTPVIRDGALFYSNLSSPGDPSLGSQKWEQHPDWKRLRSWAGNVDSRVSPATPPTTNTWAGPVNAVQARHIALRIGTMAYSQGPYQGTPQRAKVNEIVVREWSPGAGQAGQYLGRAVADVTGAIGHIITQHMGVPAAKFIPRAPAVPIGDLSIAPTTIQQAVQSVAGVQLLRLWVDGLLNHYLDPEPSSGLTDYRTTEWTWTEDNCWGPKLTGNWEPGLRVAQVVVYAKDISNLKQYVISYPEAPFNQGDILQVKDVTVASREQAQLIARAKFIDGNTRRRITINAGAVPWLRLLQRHTVNLPHLDVGGGWGGANFYVEGYSVKVGPAPDGGVAWNTTIQLRELAL